MDTIVLVLVLAVTVEALVEYGKLLGQAALSRDYQGLAVVAAALVVAVVLCFATGAVFYAALGVQFAYPWVGVLLTGVFASRGANFVSDLLSRLNSIKK